METGEKNPFEIDLPAKESTTSEPKAESNPFDVPLEDSGKKKEQQVGGKTLSSTSSSPSGTSSKQSITSGSFLDQLTGPINKALKSPLVSSTSESAPSTSGSSKENKLHGIELNQKINVDEQLTPNQSNAERKSALKGQKDELYKDAIKFHVANDNFNKTDELAGKLDIRIKQLEDEISTMPGQDKSPYAQPLIAELQKLTQEKPKVDAHLNAMIGVYNDYTKELKQTADNIYALKHPKGDSYVEGGEKAFGQGVADTFYSIQGVANFVDNTLFGGLNQKANPAHDVFTKIGDYINESGDENLSNAPKGLVGDVVTGLAGGIPLLATAVLGGEEIGAAKLFGISAFGKSYKETGDVQKAVAEGAKGYVSGAILEGLGVAGKQVNSLAENAALKAGVGETGASVLGKTSAATLVSLGFGGQALLEDFIDNKPIELNKFLSGAAQGAFFEVAGMAFGKAQHDFDNSTPEALKNAVDINKSPEEIRKMSIDIAEKIPDLKTKEEKEQAVVAAQATGKIASIKAYGEKLLTDDNFRQQKVNDILQDGSLSPEDKQGKIARIQDFVKNNDPRMPVIDGLNKQNQLLEQTIELNEKNDPEYWKEKNDEMRSMIEKNKESIVSIKSKPITINYEKSSEKSREEKSSQEIGEKGGSEKDVLNPSENGGAKEVTSSVIQNEPASVGGDESKADAIQEPLNTQENAIQEPSASGVLSSTQEGAGEAGSERRGMGQSKQGEEATQESQKEKKVITAEEQRQYNEQLLNEREQSEKDYVTPEEKAKNIQALPDEDYIKGFIDSGQLNALGEKGEMRVDFGNMSKAEILKGVHDIKYGIESVPAERLKENILKTKQVGEVPFIQGTGGKTERTNIPVQQFSEGIQESAPEPSKPANETVFVDGENYTVKRDENGQIDGVVNSKGEDIYDSGLKMRDAGKLYNKVIKVAEVKKEGASGVSKAIGESEMAELGATIQKAEPRRWTDTVLKEAAEEVASGKVDPASLLISVEKNPRTLSDTEIAILAKYKVDMKKKYNDVNEQIAKAPAGEDITHLLAQQLGLEDAAKHYEEVFSKSIRPSAGRSLAALNMILKPDYSPLTIQARAKAAEVGGDVPARVKEIYDKQVKTIAEQDAQIKELSGKVKELYQKNESVFKKADLNKALRRQEILNKAEERKSKRVATKEEIDKAIAQSFETLKRLSIEQRSTLSANPINAKMAVELGKLATNYVKKGIVDVAQIVDNIHLKLQDIIPGVSKDDIENAISDAIVSQSMKEASDFSAELESEDVGGLVNMIEKFQRGIERAADDIGKTKTKANKSEADKLGRQLEKDNDVMGKYLREAKKAQADKIKAEQKIERTIKERKDVNQPKFVKALEVTGKTYKAMILSGILTPVKLGAAVVNIAALKPAYVGMAQALSRIPGLSKIYDKAPAQKQGAGAIAKYFSTHASKEIFRESYNTLMGKGEFDASQTEKKFDDSGWLNIPGRVHAAIKVFAKIPEYEASKYQLIRDYEDKGKDPFSPENAAEIETLATANALNSVLMDDNKVAGLWNNFLLSASKSESDGVKALSALLSVEDPIVKVPLNQVTAIWEHVPVLGIVQRLGEIKRGAAQEGGYTPEQANEIARNITRQGLGLVIAGAATLLYKQFGGYQNYLSKEDKKIGIKELSVKAGEMEIPKLFLHNGAWNIAQIFATIAREGHEGKGVGAGISKATAGVAEEDVPFVRTAEETGKTIKQMYNGEGSKAAGEFVGKFLSTSDTRKLAKYVDDERKTNPQGFWEAVANDVPGLRKYVTGADDVKFAKKWAGQHNKVPKRKEDRIAGSKKHIEDVKAYNKWKADNGLK